MSVEPIGIISICIGILCMMAGYRTISVALVVATLLGSAAALLVGSANVQPAHLLLAFVAASTLTRNREAAAAARALTLPSPGFWFACLVVYGIVGGYLLPRIFAGMTQIIPIGSSAYSATIGTVPLGPVSGNFTQALYLTADLICFALISATASSEAGHKAITSAILFYCAANIIFAVLDVITYSSGTQWTLDFIRNAQYTFHLEEEASGLKRIAGSFTEASSFAHTTLGAIGFTGTMWICGRSPAWTGVLFIASIIALVLSTSSTGLVGAPPVLLTLYATAVIRSGVSPERRQAALAVLVAPMLVILAVLVVFMNTSMYNSIYDYLSSLVFNKSSTQSGMERASWNYAAIRNFFDTAGLGVGLGTARTSSFGLALLSNVGLPGVLFYCLFIYSCFFPRERVPRGSVVADVSLAARNACLGLLLGDLISGALVDQGLLFYVLAALSSIKTFSVRQGPMNLQHHTEEA